MKGTTSSSSVYDLYATVNHYGAVFMGHYIANIKSPTGDSRGEFRGRRRGRGGEISGVCPAAYLIIGASLSEPHIDITKLCILDVTQCNLLLQACSGLPLNILVIIITIIIIIIIIINIEEWLRYDDESVVYIKKQLISDNSAYLLLYRRREF